MDLGARQRSDGRPATDADGLDRLNRHQRLCEQAIELSVPLRVAAQAGWNPVRDDFERTADGIAGFTRGVHGGSHGGAHLGICAPDSILIGQSGHCREVVGQRVGDCRTANRGDVAHNLNAQVPEERARDSASRHARGCFASARPLKHVPHVVALVFQAAREVSMTRAWSRDRFPPCAGQRGIRYRLDTHGELPVDPIAITNRERDGAADGLSAANPGQDLNLILLDNHAASPSVPELPSSEIAVDVSGGQSKAGGYTVEHGHQDLTVRFTGC